MGMNEDSDIDYKRLSNYIIIAVIIIAFLVLNYCSLSKHLSSNSEVINEFQVSEDEMSKTRNPAVAGIFYASELKQLDEEVDHYLSADFRPGTSQPKILIVPHAGYMYSATIAAPAYLQLKNSGSKISNIVLVGPSHRVGFKGIAASSADEFKTPLGNVRVNRMLTEKLTAEFPEVKINDKAHQEEHSLEVQLPFLQKILGNFEIVPLVYGDVAPEKLAQVLEPLLQDDKTVVIISADLSHYYDYATAKTIDSQTANLIEQNRPEVEDHMSCGSTGINAALILAKENHLRPDMLELANSGDTAGDKNRVVGYGAWSFAPDKQKNEAPKDKLEIELNSLRDFAAYYGKDLFKIANKAVIEAAKENKRYTPSRRDYPDKIFDKGAAFVTLTQNGELRGCIGTVVPNQAIGLDVASNAYDAAMADSRFKPLKAEELKDLKVSISLLTGYERIRYGDEADLLSKIRPGVDGLIIRDGDRQGLFLPSVWQQLPDKQEFLNNLKLKAGMSPSYWSNKIKVYRFRTLEIKQDEN